MKTQVQAAYLPQMGWSKYICTRVIAHRRAAASERGFALISVVILGAFLSVLAIGLLASTRRLAYDTARIVGDIELRSANEAGLNRIIAAYSNVGDPLRVQLRPDGRPVHWEIGGRSVILSVQAESGKLDLNAGDRDHIQAVLAHLFEPSIQARILAQIDEARATRTRIESVASVLSPLGRMMVSRELMELHFTVMTGQGGIDPSSAPNTILQVMPRLPNEVRQEILDARDADRPAAVTTLSGEVRRMFTTERPIYTLRAEASSTTKRVGAMRAIVGFDERGFVSIYSWTATPMRG